LRSRINTRIGWVVDLIYQIKELAFTLRNTCMWTY